MNIPKYLAKFQDYASRFNWNYQGWIVVEVGACQGDMTVALSRFVGAKGKVYAVEPEPRNFFELLKNTKGLSNVVPLNFGLSNEMCVKDLILSVGRADLHSYKRLTVSRFGLQAGTVSSVLMSWDDFVRVYGVSHVDLCCIDVEGLEREVLTGMTGCLPKRLVVAKYHSGMFEGCLSGGELRELLKGKGYKVLGDTVHDLIASS